MIPIAMDDYLGLRRVVSAVPSPDGAWLAVQVARLDAEGSAFRHDLWRVPLDDSAPSRLTVGEHDDTAPGFRRDGSLAFLSDRPTPSDEDPSGRRQVWLLPAGGGEPRCVTDEPLGVSAFEFAAAADRLVVLAPTEPGVADEAQRAAADRRRQHGPSARRYTTTPVRVWDHWLGPAHHRFVAMDERGQGRRDLTPDAGGALREPAWRLSPDGASLATAWIVAGEGRIEDSHLVTIDVATGLRTEVHAAPRTSTAQVRWSADGSQLAWVKVERGPERVFQARLWLRDVRTAEIRKLAADWDRQPELHGFAPDGSALVVTAADRGCVPVFAVHALSGKVKRVTSQASEGTHTGLSVLHDGTVVGVRSRLTHPPEPFEVALSGESDPQLLGGLSGWSPARGAEVASVERLGSRAEGGPRCESWLVRPADAEHDVPLLVWIHGGPHSQWADGWHWRWNPLLTAARGYAVLLPNPRGSTGQGHAFTNGVWGGRWPDAEPDVLAATEAAAGLQGIDGDRAAAMGGSYGGYLTNWLMGAPGRYRCFISHAGIWDFRTLHGGSDFGPWFDEAAGGVAWTDDAAMAAQSPRSRHEALETPTLVIHGEKDYRCPIHEALSLFEALQHRGVASELLVFPDEGHWIVKPANIRAWHEAVWGWLERWLAD